MWFTRVSIHHPVFATMMMLALMVLGLFSANRLPVEEFPDVKFPVVVINTTYPGASPEIVETEVSKKIEEVVSAVNGLKRVYSYSYEGLSIVVAEFELTVNPEIAVQDVREKVATIKRALRKEVDEPTISRFSPDERPIVSIAMTSERLGLRELTTRADRYVQKQYQTIKGVGKVSLVGEAKREIQVLLKPEAMHALGIGADQVVAALKAENQELPAGSLRVRGGEQLVQIQGKLPTPEAFARLVVTQRGGQPIYLGQVAAIKDSEAERESSALVNGKTALTLDIVKIQGGNTIEVADRVQQKTEELRKELASEGIELTILNDGSRGVRRSLSGVKRNMVEGALLTVVIVFLFLGSWRSTIITGLTLPVAIVGTFYFLYIAGFTINVMTLMALSLCVGLLIDDAIVVRENIVRHAGMGKSAYQAALDGTQEIGLAVFATTMSIVAVFLPVGFMGGIIGKFFYQFGLTVVAAVLISMLVSFTLDPMLSSIWPDPHAHGEKHGGRFIGPILDWFEGWMDRVTAFYTRTITWALGHRKTVLGIATASLVAAFMLVPVVGGEFVPEPDLSRLRVRFDTVEGAALDYTEAKARQAEAALREFPEVIETYTSINVGGSLGKNAAVIDLRLKPRAERTRSQKELVPLFRARLLQLAGIRLKGIVVPDGPGGAEKPIYLSIQGADFAGLKQISAQVMEKLKVIPGIADLDSSLKEAKPSLDVHINRELAAQAGLSVERIGAALRPLIAGDAATTWKAPDGENYDVRVRLPADERTSAAKLAALPFAGSSEGNGRPRMIPLSQIAEIESTFGPTQINRRALSREIAITAGLAGRPLAAVTEDIQKALKTINLPPGYRFDISGASKDMAESAAFAGSALLLAVIFIYMVLGSQFGSFSQPLAIMTSLPLSLIGVMLALLLSRSTLNIFSIIGVIMLMGLVTKNAILLIDFTNQLRREGMARFEAIVHAGEVRLRPILMTTFAMVAGMLPLVFTGSEGAEQRAPMAHAIIGGVITSTLLTLIVVPVAFTYLDDGAARLKRWWKGGAPAGTAG